MYQKLTLKNGLPVILAPKKGSKSVALFVIYKVGSRHELKQKLYGVSHFIEHLMFKGTKKRPSTLVLSKELDSIGAEFNAFTAKDHTAYHIKVNAGDFKVACDIFSDMLNNSKFDQKELEKEKGVILEEIKMYEDQPIQYAEILFEQSIFKGLDLEHNIAGTRKTVKALTRQDIIGYLEKFYSPKNAALIVSGKVDKNTLKVLNKYFNQQGFGHKFQKRIEHKPISITQKAAKAALEFKTTSQAHVALGFPAYSYASKKLPAFHLLAIILGGNMSSRLFINVREREGLCYYIRSQADIYEDTGDLLIRSGLDNDKLEKGLALIAKELKDIKDNGVTAEELSKAKKFIKGRLTMQLEELNDLAEFYGREFILAKKLMTPEQRIKEFLKVSLSQVNQVAKEVLLKDKMNFVMVGPNKNKEKYLKLLNL